MVSHHFIPTLARQKQVHRHEFKDSPAYRARSRSARTAKQKNLASKEGGGREREKRREKGRKKGGREIEKEKEKGIWFWLAKA